MATKRETWAYALGKFLIDPVWWMLLFWLPDYFKKTFDLNVTTFGLVLAAIRTKRTITLWSPNRISVD